MGWIDTWYPNAIQALCEIRGTGAPGVDGVSMPMIRPLETVSVLSVLAKPICDAIQTFQAQTRGNLFAGGGELGSDRVLPSAILNDGILGTDLNAFELVQTFASAPTIAEYLQGQPHPSYAWKRAAFTLTQEMRDSMNAESLAIMLDNMPYYEPWIPESLSEESDLLAQCDMLVAHWQNGIDASAACLLQSGLSFAGEDAVTNSQALAGFLVAVRKMCLDLDALASNPPQSTLDKVREATKDAIEEVGNVAGETAAHAAETVGRTAGAAAKGFFDKAGFMALAVGGIAVAIALR